MRVASPDAPITAIERGAISGSRLAKREAADARAVVVSGMVQAFPPGLAVATRQALWRPALLLARRGARTAVGRSRQDCASGESTMQLVRLRLSFWQASTAESRDRPISRARYSVPWPWRTLATVECAPPSDAFSLAVPAAACAWPALVKAPTCTAQPPAGEPPRCVGMPSAIAGWIRLKPPRCLPGGGGGGGGASVPAASRTIGRDVSASWVERTDPRGARPDVGRACASWMVRPP